ncbi:MAG: IS1634 family transposase [Actinobacteria bacterium]|nr:IS1634 family transposase [Actinomycetota bacterium]
MSYVIQQKIGKYTYVYEVESYWDKAKKQPRQKRKYVGKKDPDTGEIIAVQKGFVPRVARDFGHIHLIINIVNRIGLFKVLKEVFPDLYQELLYLSLFQVLESKPLYLFKPWAEGSLIEDGLELSSQRISSITEELGKREELRTMFFRSWAKNQGDIKGIIFDITSLSSYSKLIEYLEWGYNRDGDKLPQVNLGLIVGQPSELPIAYRIYPGSIADVSTLKNIILLLEYLGVSEFTFILDRGFYSTANINQMQDERINFVLPLSFSTKLSSQLISRHLKALHSPLNGFYYKGRPMFHVRVKMEVAGSTVYAHLYHDEKRRAEELEHLMRRIVEIEAAVLGKEFWNIKDVEEYLSQSFSRSMSLFEITKEEGRYRLVRRAKAISRLMNRMGKTILVTNNSALGREDILNLYRRKDVLEKMFDSIKNELEGGRLKVSSREAMEGRIFLTYLSLILYSALSKIMGEKNLYKTYTLAEVFYELKKLKVVTLSNGKSYMTEISKTQRTLFEYFGVPIPVGP